jgi:Spy/CpxP family protein refolding chaperone
MSALRKSLMAGMTALALGAAGASAQPPDAPPAPGWGMGGYGPGARGGYGGMGPGVMGGPGMMGGYGRGYGRGYGMGSGMMGGPGMMGGGALFALDLTEAQRKEVLAIQDETRKKNWTAMGAMHDEMAKLRDALWSGERDRAKIAAANRRMFELRQQMLDNRLDAAERIEKVLTPQQRESLLRRWGPGWMLAPDE